MTVGGMDFRGAAAKVRSLIAAKKPQELQRSTLTADPLRDNIVNEAAASSERFKASLRRKVTVDYEVTHEDGTKEQKSHDWTGWPDMLRDCARSNFSLDEPELAGPGTVQPSRMLNREIMAERLISDGFQESRPYTRNNELESLFGAMAEGKSLEESAQTRLAEHIARSSQMEEQEDAIRSAEEMLEELRKRAREQIEANGEVDDATRRQIKQQVKSRQNARTALQNLLQQAMQSTLIADASAAAQAASQAGAEAAEAVRSLPGIGAGQAQNMSPDQQIALAEKWSANEQLRRIAQMIGRLYRDMRFKREARTKNVPIEPVGVTTGNDFGRLLPHEMARAFSDNRLIKATFLNDYAQRALLEYEMSGKMPAGKGPIICAHDGSGSMSGEPFIWASSLGGALLMMAQREKRAFAGIEFGWSSELESWIFPKAQPPDPDRVLDYISHFFGGGTDITIGLAEAMRILQQEPEFKTADVILITDGQDNYQADDQALVEEMKRMGVRIHGISIGCPNGNVYLDQACEYVVDVQDLAGSNDATDRVAGSLT
jgi:uncharacterized protein with von Willebrand factor type A (vWA) domain